MMSELSMRCTFCELIIHRLQIISGDDGGSRIHHYRHCPKTNILLYYTYYYNSAILTLSRPHSQIQLIILSILYIHKKKFNNVININYQLSKKKKKIIHKVITQLQIIKLNL